VTVDRLLAAAARDVGRPLAELGDQPLHALAPLREDVRLTLDLGAEHAHANEPSGRLRCQSLGGTSRFPQTPSPRPLSRTGAPRRSVPCCKSRKLDKRLNITQSEQKGEMRIEVHPEAREELLEFLRRANCITRVEDDGSVIVEVPDALGEDQARLEVELYIKAWQASHPDVEAHLIH
jgi:hypothetical protein